MEETFRAYGLSLRSSFPLPGMEPPRAAESLPPLDLDLVGAAELAAAWSGPVGRPWEGRLGDGERLALAWGMEGDLLFEYGQHARFHLDRARGRLLCAPTRPSAIEWRRVLLTRVLPNVAIACGYEALHAAAVETETGVLAIAGRGGAGKSSLLAELAARGVVVFADDTVVLERDGDEVLAHPSTPHMNLSTRVGTRDPREIGRPLGTLAGETWVAVEDRTRGRMPLRAMVTIERSGGLPLGLHHEERGMHGIFPHMLGLPDDDDREANRFALYSTLAANVDQLRLSADPTIAPGELAAILEAELDLAAAEVVA
jgi:hypothetical protein